VTGDAAVRYTPGQLARLLGLPEPTAEQAAVIAAPLSPVAVIAGAGSGKSETMAARLVWLVANGLARPERMLGLTFTRKAAAELADRVRRRLDGLRRAGLEAGLREVLAGEPVICTYHAYAGRLVTDHALREAMEPSMRLITPAVAWQIASTVVAAYDGPVDAIDWAPRSVTAAVLQLAGELAEHLRVPADILNVSEWLILHAADAAGRPAGQESDAAGSLSGRKSPANGRGGLSAAARKILACQRTREQLLPMIERYAEAKRSREVIDYGDQVTLAARLAQRHPEVGAGERGRYQVVLLDEYQDTSEAQLVMLRTLFGGGHPVTAVGDPCQSIYGWRGASAGNLRRFATHFDGAYSRTLSTSFRNTGKILEAAAMIQRSLRAEAPQVPRLVAAPGLGNRGRVTCALHETAADEAEWVGRQVADLLRMPPGIAPDGRRWPGGRKDPVRPSDIAVLCRKRVQFDPLRKALEARGIPVEVVGLGGLLTVPEVQDVVATLRVLHDPAASDALARLLTGPRWRIGPRDLIALGRRARKLAATGREPTSPSGDQDEGDALTQAVADLTTDAGSLIEALDDLGDPAAYSPAGYTRLSALAAELRTLRAHAARPLADLVGEVERTLSLDIEVAARPGIDPAAARADLDAFAGTAAAFGTDQEEATLGAFLAYLTAAQEEEFGLEAGKVGETDTVKLVTVHAAKGLQWNAVVVPGLSAGDRSQIFPARPRQTTRWPENPRLLPFGLRGDAADLPTLTGLDQESLKEFTQSCSERELTEERRLMYVAATRAAFWLGCSGYWWGDGVLPLGPSVFLEEIAEACRNGAGTIAHWAPPPEPGAENPALAEPASATWPAPPEGDRYEAVRDGAALVRGAMEGKIGPGCTPASEKEVPPRDNGARVTDGDAAREAHRPVADDQAGGEGDGLDEHGQTLMASWARDTTLLLAERERWRGEAAHTVELPGQLSVSALVTLARDPAELASQIRRPMPLPPAPQARRGTAFHRWLEQHYGAQQLIDPADLVGTPGADEESEADLAFLRELFEAGAWSGRWPREVEVPFETQIGDRLIRGRIDAVFADAGDGCYDVVDWKTGRPPGSAAERHAVAVQLAAYRLAWAALAGVPLEKVRAAFYYVRHDLTISPADLLDAEGLAALIESVPLTG